VFDVYASGSSIYAATSGGLSFSTDGGTNFTNYTTAHGLASSVVSGAYASGSTIYAATAGGLSIAQQPNPVPAPLPVLGSAFPLSSCRRLRRQSKRLRLASGTGQGWRA
jgi:hypothetical protein